MQTHPVHYNDYLSQNPRNRGSRLGQVLGNWYRARVRNIHRRRMIEELRAMDDKILRDIGINRGEIHSIVYGFSDDELKMVPTKGDLRAH
ncbi:DUF1127 domain-containing protein [Gymnodinialimonas sp. 57CJ19]|uniref:DUF1127 domain-containing protein n=1 Tax=Gymnodinialimonas sp. 57CJ19 TaxID=3138498 RepID=UPI00313438E0